jgi:hypothetical protein
MVLIQVRLFVIGYSHHVRYDNNAAGLFLPLKSLLKLKKGLDFHFICSMFCPFLLFCLLRLI